MDLSLSSLAKEKDHGAVRASLPNLEIVLGKLWLDVSHPCIGLALLNEDYGNAPECKAFR
ncbi:hypothetical protein GCM10009100_40630 [Thalassospira tepidiphila]